MPFFVSLLSPTIDWTIHDGFAEIPIEERDQREITHVWGRDADNTITDVQVAPDGTPGGNPAFDVTPSRLVTGLITERGTTPASGAGLAARFPELASAS